MLHFSVDSTLAILENTGFSESGLHIMQGILNTRKDLSSRQKERMLTLLTKNSDALTESHQSKMLVSVVRTLDPKINFPYMTASFSKIFKVNQDVKQWMNHFSKPEPTWESIINACIQHGVLTDSAVRNRAPITTVNTLNNPDMESILTYYGVLTQLPEESIDWPEDYASILSSMCNDLTGTTVLRLQFLSDFNEVSDSQTEYTVYIKQANKIHKIVFMDEEFYLCKKNLYLLLNMCLIHAEIPQRIIKLPHYDDYTYILAFAEPDTFNALMKEFEDR